MLALGGRAPAARWGMGSLQEIDHMPFVAPLTKLARTAEATADIPALVDEALRAALEPPSGPTFIDFPHGPGVHGGGGGRRHAGLAARPDGAAEPPTATPSTARPSCCAAPSGRW